MSDTDFDIHYVANLARLDLKPDEETHLGEQLRQILGYVEKLKELDVEAVEPTSHPFPMINVLRKDTVTPSLPHDCAMKNAPKAGNGLFMVPKIVD